MTLILLSSLAMAGAANAANVNQGFYVSTSPNANHVKVDSKKGYYPKLSHTAFTPRLAVGYDFGTYRVEVNYANLGKIKYRDKATYADVKVKDFGLSAMYNFAPSHAFQPYLGAHLIYTKAKTYAHTSKSKYSKRENSVGLGALAGVEYQFNNSLFGGVNLEYAQLTSKINSASAGISLRYKF